MSNLAKIEPVWITKDGKSVFIKQMTTEHLLNTIHLIERKRMNDLIETYGIADINNNLKYYSQWPDRYLELIKEAKRRNLIGR